MSMSLPLGRRRLCRRPKYHGALEGTTAMDLIEVGPAVTDVIRFCHRSGDRNLR